MNMGKPTFNCVAQYRAIGSSNFFPEYPRLIGDTVVRSKPIPAPPMPKVKSVCCEQREGWPAPCSSCPKGSEK
jgi:hypothetical protein